MAKSDDKGRVGFDTSRTKGGQPGNVSALSHGFYGRLFSDDELIEIGRLAVADLALDEEIAMLRVLMRRLVETDLGPSLVIELFGRASGQLRRLLESKARLEAQGKDTGGVSRAYDDALDALAEDMGVDL